MLPPIDEWTEETVRLIATPAETLEVEKKAKDKFDFSTGKAKSETQEELLKQVCAFANASRGFLVYGIDKAGNLDTGIEEVIPSTRELAKSWVEGLVPKGTYPPIQGCQARHIPVPGHHAPGYGVLVVEIPLSDYRPHWIKLNGQDVPYIRTGEHSGRMSIQTLLDISSRTGASLVEIVDLGLLNMEQEPNCPRRIHLNPRVKLVAGPMCEHWAFQLVLRSATGGFGSVPSNGRRLLDSELLLTGAEPLFPGRVTRVGASNIMLNYHGGMNGPGWLDATLCAGSSKPVTKQYHMPAVIAEAFHAPAQRV
jgi:hypothetical protein